MRPDMSKVIVEKPRVCGDGGRSIPAKGYKKRLRDLDAVKREPMKARYTGGTKELSERLGPLQKFLRSRVGRRWDDVYSEICEHIRIDSAVQSHIRDHVDRDVEKNVVMIGRVPCDPLTGHKIYRELYVCDGVLRFYPYKKRKAETVKPLEIDGKQYHRVNDVWFEVELAPLPPRVKVNSRWTGDIVTGDVLFRKPVAQSVCARQYGKKVYAVKKRSLNGKEIKRLGLRSEPNGR